MSINQLYDNLASNNNTYLTYVDVGLLFSTEYGYGFAQTQPYRGSDLTYSKIIDWLHPSTAGYYMESDCIVPAFLSLNIS